MRDFSWLDQVDIYCERTDFSFWSEPLNALSNASFLIAAFCLWRRYRASFPGPGTRQWEVELLIALIGVVGVGSFLFHTLATQWAQAADVIPIILALLWAIGVFLKRRMRYSNGKTALGYALFFAATAACSMIPSAWFNDSQLYFSTAASLFVMGVLTSRKELPGSRRLMAAGITFVAALACRSIDLAVCEGLPIGTHFLWHSLNGLAFYLAVSTLVD